MKKTDVNSQIRDLPEDAKVRLAGICRGHYNSNREECTKQCMKIVAARCKEDTLRRKKEENKLLQEKSQKSENIQTEEFLINGGKKMVYKYFFGRMDDGFDNYKQEIKNEIEFRYYYIGSENKCIIQIAKNGDLFITTSDFKEKVNAFVEKNIAKNMIKKIFNSCNLKLRNRV